MTRSLRREKCVIIVDYVPYDKRRTPDFLGTFNSTFALVSKHTLSSEKNPPLCCQTLNPKP